MIQGTTSDAGKSTIVAGLCRILKRRNISVAPFKPQNMALNSAVTSDGGEIGRAQAVQALAAGIEPHTDMNPILLKPNTDTGAQVIIQGHAISNMEANDYHDYKNVAKQAVLESYHRLNKQYDVILVEGAGSPAEVNLRHNDIANMGFAESIDCPVWIVSDIDRGGVFAHLTGTLSLLSKSEQDRVTGFIINRFRGDYSLLEPGIDWLTDETNIKTIGTIPYIHGLYLEAEDALANNKSERKKTSSETFNIIAPLLPHISNHTDLDPLLHHPQVNFSFISHNEKIPHADLIILPGSKNVHFDLQWMLFQGWKKHIDRHLRYGGKLIGICGGFQMLGTTLLDPDKTESNSVHTAGLNYFDMITTLQCGKTLKNVTGTFSFNDKKVSGYEIHTGQSVGPALNTPAFHLNDGDDGAISNDNQILGTYLHGIFDSDSACQTLLDWAGLSNPQTSHHKAFKESHIDNLADVMEENLDINEFLNHIS